ncbi:MAG: homoserine kinase [Actinomycetota bacterium]|nr:homoserine kinase [Actinomycetota bacterium]
MERVTVRVPATTANLGPGYDTFGLALGLYNTFSATPAAEWAVEISGEGADTLARDSANYVARAMSLGLTRAGSDIKAAHIECSNEVPPGRGLGSSAVAIVAGLMLADALTDGALGRDRVFALAVEMEGHADNVAAAVYGGFTIGWDDGAPRARSVTMAGGLATVVVIAERELSTTRARDMLPSTVPHADAAFNAAHAGLVIAGVMSGDRELLAAGLHDRLHQPYRAAEVPDLNRVTAALRAAGCEGAVLSGAGPTIVGLVLAEDDERAFERALGVCELALAPLSMIPGRRPPLALVIDRHGAMRL